MKQSGWRKPTPGLCVAEQHAKAGEQKAVPKAQALNAAKRVAAHLGLKAPERLLLDLLGAFSQPQDWDPAQRPIVWPSNGLLMEQTGFSLSALKRHIRRLAEAGLIAFRDSPNGKRWGRRSPDGTIIEAYGFDLSPMAERAQAFEALHQRITAERALCKKLKRELTALRRGIAANIALLEEQTPMAGDAFLARFDPLLLALPRKTEDAAVLARTVALFTELDRDLRCAIIAGCDVQETSAAEEQTASTSFPLPDDAAPKGPETGPHIQTTKQPQDSNRSAGHPDDPPQKEAKRRTTTCPTMEAARRKEPKPPIPPAMVFETCREFAAWSPESADMRAAERRLLETAQRVRPMTGISETDWRNACESLGETTASAALALIVDKTASGAIRSPSGYLRGMIRKATRGELNLARSFHGRLAGHSQAMNERTG